MKKIIAGVVQSLDGVMQAPLWNLLDMTPEGRGDFSPKLAYQAKAGALLS
ncbi:MAG: hypothetical protein ABIO86_07490 [Sphingomonas sp.]